jgi:hypothetical protein
MARTTSGRKVRFDTRCQGFAAITAEYREALKRAEKLWRRLQRDRVRRSPTKSARLWGELAGLEDRLDAARAALREHTRKIAVDPMRTRVKNLGLDRGRGVA